METIKNARVYKPLSLIGLLYATNHLFATIYIDGGQNLPAVSGWLGYVYDNLFSNTENSYEEFIELMHPFLEVFLTTSELESL